MAVSPPSSTSVFQSAWKAINHNGWLKFLSVVFAMVLFFLVRAEQVKEYTKVAKIRIVTSSQVIVVGPSERAIDVTVRLPRAIFFRQPTDQELIGEIDASRLRPGKIRVRLGRENFPTLDKKFALTIHDPWIEFELDNLIKKSVAVRAILQGLPKEGLGIDRVIVEPREVEVSGAKREVSKFETLSTSPINIENIDRNFTTLTKLVVDDSSSMRVSHEKVNVQVFIGAQKVSRMFRSIPVQFPRTQRVELKPAFVDVELQGAEDVMETLTNAEVLATIDTADLNNNWQERKVSISIPANTTLVRTLPDTVQARRRK